MLKRICVPVAWAWALLAVVPGAGQLCAAKAGTEEEDVRVLSMGEDPEEKSAADTGEWEEIFKANNYDKLTLNENQTRKAELAEDFDEDILERERLRDWYGASEECAGPARLPTHKELLKIWDAECKESTSTVCSASYWTSEKKDDKALCVNFLNGYVVSKDLDSFAYIRCVGGKQGRKTAKAATSRTKAGKKKGANPSEKIVGMLRNFRPVKDGPSVWEKLSVLVTGEGGSISAVSWEVKTKKPGVYSAVAVVPVSEGEIKYTFSVNSAKNIVMPVDARAKAVFKAITDPDIADGAMR